jgi:S-DNA-T family DNA segregation ATPase FtsK/SpoIIIE
MFIRVTSCPECHFVCKDVPVSDIPVRLRAIPSQYGRALNHDLSSVSLRPEPDIWSAMEYTCHIRDVLLVQRERVVSALVEDRPTAGFMHRDERVTICGYDAHDAAEVLSQLEMAAELCATVFEGLSATQWERPIIYLWPATAERDVAWVGRNVVHEGVHHLMDIERVLNRVVDRG